MTQQRLKNMDWMLKDLAVSVPQTRHVVVLSADGLCMAQFGTDPDSDHATDKAAADRLAAASSGLKSLAQSVAAEFPEGDGGVRMVAIEVEGGFYYLMAAGPQAYLAVTADEGVSAGLMSQRMRDLVARLGEHLTSPPRTSEQAP